MKEKQILYMIGNSHIDPVWFWDWDEGMQEVKATFSSALDRLREYPEMTFTATSTAFFEWIQETAPELFEEIKMRVKEGRFLLTGGWYNEPDCILPCTEAFVRQGLYGQRYLLETFGIMSRTGSNADGFGHHPMLPQILRKSGMNEYVFMRPRLDTPAFWWESKDGSRILALSLPSEYTTWFYESTKEAVQMAARAAEKAGLHGIPCCFGVGNHGGGPTIQNIKTIYQLREEFENLDLRFSGYHAFFDEMTPLEKERLPVRNDFFDGVNTGCYSVDSELKQKNRMAERRLMMADAMLCLEAAVTGTTEIPADSPKVMETLWKKLLFNQFHDTLGGTAAKPARDEAIMQFSWICAQSKQVWVRAVQNIANHLNTAGEGFPLFLFNPAGEDYEGPIELELNWFCKDHLILLDDKGNETAYQRTYTQAKVRNYNLGGRRAIVFHARIPAAGFLIYRTVEGIPAQASDIRNAPEFPLPVSAEKTFRGEDFREGDLREGSGPFLLENDILRAEFSKDGFLSSVYHKKENWEMLSGPVEFPVWTDQRDTWGGYQERPFEDSGNRLAFEKLELVEDGSVRKQVRAVYSHGGSKLIQTYTLYHDGDYLEVKNRLFWEKEWSMLHLAFPIAGNPRETLAECAGGTFARRIEDTKEYSMHRFLDVVNPDGSGLCIANDGKYAYSLQKNTLDIVAARSAIFAQGNGKNWYNEVEGYQYTDQGPQEFTLLLKPHGKAIPVKAAFRLARLAEKSYLYLADNIHEGSSKLSSYSLLQCGSSQVQVTALKRSEDGKDMIVRLLETEGKDTLAELTVAGTEYKVFVSAYEIKTVKIDIAGKILQNVNLLEFQEENC